MFKEIYHPQQLWNIEANVISTNDTVHALFRNIYLFKATWHLLQIIDILENVMQATLYCQFMFLYKHKIF